MVKKNSKVEKKTNTVSDWIPYIPIREMVIFPLISAPFYIGRKRSLKSLGKALKTDKKIFVVTQKNSTDEEPKNTDLYSIGVIGKIVKILKIPNGRPTIKVIFEGEYVAKATIYTLKNEMQLTKVKKIGLPLNNIPKKIHAHVGLIKEQFNAFLKRNNHIPINISQSISLENNPIQLCYKLAPLLKLTLSEKQELLEMIDLGDMLSFIYNNLVIDDERYKIEELAKDKISKQIRKSQKEFYLNEQIRAIQKELGNEDQKSEYKELEIKLSKAGMPKETLEIAMNEYKKLQSIPPISSESNIIRSYLDWLTNIPWKKKTKDNPNLINTKKVLDDDHYGLIEIKDRIIEYLALIAKSKKIRGPIICLNGPPGVGKTSLAISIAKALGRNFHRMSLGGIRDEAEIRGHRRTYIGAMPGKIIYALRRVKSINPIILLDEVDKLSISTLGNPAAALLEALDPEQNHSFVDHYLEVAYNLSHVMFICTSNNKNDIPSALRDRMEIIDLIGYSETEKRHIFEKHLWPKQLKNHLLENKQITINEVSIRELINYYTKEPGIRELERTIEKILRKANRELLTNKKKKKIIVNSKIINKYLGAHKYRQHQLDSNPRIGVVNGLAWTPAGGDILIIEVLIIPGRKGELYLTGKLGEVMRESAKTALSYVRSNANKYGINFDLFTNDIHIHAPEGAIPKEGPSAGVTLATALVSALTKIPVKNDIAITGEITLNGRLLAIGGLKEKLLSALRSGVGSVYIPALNQKDLEDFDKDVKKDLTAIEIATFSDIHPLICSALVTKPKPLMNISTRSINPTNQISKGTIETN